MSGSRFGTCFVVSTAGESHGPANVAIVDGCPPGLPLTESDIQPALDRRKPGSSRFTTQRKESDHVQILSGVFEGITTGAPIALLIHNEDQKSKDYTAIASQFRPGHADFTYQKKYGIRDYRGGGRASARETVVRVAAGAIAQKLLSERLNLKIIGYLSQMGDIAPKQIVLDEIHQNPFFFPDKSQIPELEAAIHSLRRAGDSVGAKVTVMAQNVPIGLGDPVFDKLDATIAHAMMSIPAVKGVEIGDGFGVITQRGSEHRDEMTQEGFLSNHAGGTLGGISSGQDLQVNIALKPTSSITTPGRSVDTSGEEVSVVTTGRHDPCVGIRAVPIAEAMLALTLADHYLKDLAQNSRVNRDA